MDALGGRPGFLGPTVEDVPLPEDDAAAAAAAA
jgi:hypothetical protein